MRNYARLFADRLLDEFDHLEPDQEFARWRTVRSLQDDIGSSCEKGDPTESITLSAA